MSDLDAYADDECDEQDATDSAARTSDCAHADDDYDESAAEAEFLASDTAYANSGPGFYISHGEDPSEYGYEWAQSHTPCGDDDND